MGLAEPQAVYVCVCVCVCVCVSLILPPHPPPPPPPATSQRELAGREGKCLSRVLSAEQILETAPRHRDFEPEGEGMKQKEFTERVEVVCVSPMPGEGSITARKTRTTRGKTKNPLSI